MAIAGKVAITLATENGGAWSADVTYDRLVAVKHNNNLYISRKTVANVEPPNDEFWFLALEGYSGEDVQALIDRINAIISGAQQVGNAKTLDGHGAEFFAPKTDLSNYLPLTGGTVATDGTTPLRLKNNTADVLYLQMLGASGVLGYFAMNGKDKPSFISTTGAVSDILHTGNKPTGTYTGNGSAEQRTITVSSLCNGVVIRTVSSTDFAIVTPSGYIAKSGNSVVVGSDAYSNSSGFVLKTVSALFNTSGTTYNYFTL